MGDYPAFTPCPVRGWGVYATWDKGKVLMGIGDAIVEIRGVMGTV